MGGGSWTSADFADYSKAHRGKRTEEIFTRKTVNPDFKPADIKVRESCDSPDHPRSTPIIVAFDVTGSMREIPAEMVKSGLPTVIEQTLTHKPVPDPQFLMLAVGDAYYDRSPLQATQFESDIRIAKQLTDFYLEGGGGGNAGESYHLAWYFAANKTKTDSLTKRGKKGIMFTIGDEPCLPVLEKHHIEQIFGDEEAVDLTSQELIAMAEKHYDLYHIVCTHGYNTRASYDHVVDGWTTLMGKERVIVLNDHRTLPEVIAATLRVHAGEATADVAKTWSGTTAVAVVNALKNLPTTTRGGGKPSVWRPPTLARA